MPDQRDDLQRVALGAQVAVWEISEDGLSKTETMKAEIESGQLAELKWCHSGSALLVHCTTEVDDTGKSYYGVSKLRFRPDSARSSAPCMARERLKMLYRHDDKLNTVYKSQHSQHSQHSGSRWFMSISYRYGMVYVNRLLASADGGFQKETERVHVG